MPRLPFSLAGGEIPSQIPAGRASPGGAAYVGQAISGLGEELSQAGQQWQVVSQKLRQEQAEMEVISLAQEYDNRLTAIRTEVKALPNPLDQENVFVKRAQQLEQQMRQASQNPITQRALQKHMASTFGKNVSAVRSEMLQQFDLQQLAWLDRQEDELSRKAAESADPAEAQEARATYEGLVRRFSERAVIKSPLDAEKRVRSFRDKTLEKQMDVLRRTDPDTLLRLETEGAFNDLEMGKRLRVLEQVRKDQEHRAAEEAKQFATAKEAVKRVWSADANFGRLSDADLRDAMDNKHPYITPTEARELARINVNPPTKEADQAIAALRQEYLLGESTLGRIVAFRERLSRILAEIGKPSEEGAKFGDELQTDERTMKGIHATEIRNIQADAVNALRASQKPGTGIPFIDKTTRDQEKIDEAKARTEIRRGKDAGKVVQDILNTRTRKDDLLPKEKQEQLRIIEEAGK